MNSLTRRNFIQAGGAVAAGAALVGGPLAHASTASAAVLPKKQGQQDDKRSQQDDDLVPTGTDHLVMVVRDPSKGEISLLTHGNEVIFHDPQLVARVQRAMSRNQK